MKAQFAVNFAKMTPEEKIAYRNEMKAKYANETKVMSDKEVAKMNARNREVKNVTVDEMEEIRLASRMNQRNSSMR